MNTASERMLRKCSKEVITDNLQAEGVPFTFSLKPGGEEIRAAPLVFIPDLKAKIFQLLDKNRVIIILKVTVHSLISRRAQTFISIQNIGP